MGLLCYQQYFKQSSLCLSRENVCGQFHKQTLTCEVLFLSTILRICCQQCFQKVTSLYQGMQDPILLLRGEIQLLRSSRHFDCHRCFEVILSLLNEGVHGVQDIGNWMVETRFQIVVWRVGKFCSKKHKISLWHFGTRVGRIFPKLQPSIAPPALVASLKKHSKELSVLSGRKFRRRNRDFIVNESIVKWRLSTFLIKFAV